MLSKICFIRRLNCLSPKAFHQSYCCRMSKDDDLNVWTPLTTCFIYISNVTGNFMVWKWISPCSVLGLFSFFTFCIRQISVRQIKMSLYIYVRLLVWALPALNTIYDRKFVNVCVCNVHVWMLSNTPKLSVPFWGTEEDVGRDLQKYIESFIFYR